MKDILENEVDIGDWVLFPNQNTLRIGELVAFHNEWPMFRIQELFRVESETDRLDDPRHYMTRPHKPEEVLLYPAEFVKLSEDDRKKLFLRGFTI